MSKKKKFLSGGIAALIGLTVIGSVAGHKTSATTTPPATVASSQPVSPSYQSSQDADTTPAPSIAVTQTIPASKPKPAPKPVTTPAPAPAPGPTTGEQQALESAQQYLSMGSGFSRAGLIQQLSSSSGDGFSVADATWAVDHSGANWDQQAVDSAKGYMQMGGFSRQSLLDQLTSSSGEQFTQAQAEYALSQVYGS